MVELGGDHRAVAQAIRDFAEAELAENAFTWESEIPWENMELLAQEGIVGINAPTEYGGSGLSGFEALLALEIVTSVCPDTGYHIFGMLMGAPPAVASFGSEQAKERYLEPVCHGKSILPIAMSEPEAGSDLGSIQTRVTETNGDRTITGEKMWVGDVPSADAAVVWAKFPDDTLGSVIVDLDASGVKVLENYENMMGGTQTHFSMDAVPVPDENVLVRGRNALKQQLASFNWERLGSAAFSAGLARRALTAGIDHAKNREQFEQPIAEFQGLRWKVAEMATDIQATQSLTYRAARAARRAGTPPDRLDSSAAKLYSGRMVEDVVSESLQLFGARGYQRGHPLEYLYRMQRSRRIAGGTDEMMLENLANVVFEHGGVPDPV